MGLILLAVCDHCDLQESISFGAGMSDFTTVCNVPAINRKTGKLVVKNYLKHRSSKSLSFYNQPNMYSGDLGDEYHEWDDVLLKQTGNLCPNCKSFTMNFELLACYD
jgi:hypothetical protein